MAILGCQKSVTHKPIDVKCDTRDYVDAMTLYAKFHTIRPDRGLPAICDVYTSRTFMIFRLDALALSVIATATWLGGWVAGWVAGCHTPVLYQNR